MKAAGEGVLRVLATKEDYGGLAEHLAAIGRTIVVGFKATGTYRRALTYYLITAGFELWLISSIALARTRETLHNGWDENVPEGGAGYPAQCCGLTPLSVTSTRLSLGSTICKNCLRQALCSNVSSPRHEFGDGVVG